MGCVHYHVHNPHPIATYMYLALSSTYFTVFSSTYPSYTTCPLHALLTMGSSDTTAGRLLLLVTVWLDGRLPQLLAVDLDVEDWSVKDKT